MKRMVITSFVIIGLLAASSALAVSLQPQRPLPQSTRSIYPNSPAAALFCDNEIYISSLYQDKNDRVGNLFDFGVGEALKTVTFWHYGFGFAGPYDYDLEIYDGTSHTLVGAKTGLVALNAADTSAYEVVDMCPSGFTLSGTMLVAVRAKTCIPGGAPDGTDDCYPDLLYDNQHNVVCPIVISPNNTPPGWQEVSSLQGPFGLRVATGCLTPTRRSSWGQVKSTYR